MAEIRSVVNTSSRHFHVLFYNIHQYSPTRDFFFKLLCALNKAFMAKWKYKGCRGDDAE